MKFILFILLFATLAVPANALVRYDVLFTDAEVYVNSTIYLTSKSETDIWDLTFTIPSTVDIINIADEKPITSYSFMNGKLKFKTHKDGSRFAETINIYYRDLNGVDRVHYPLKKGQVNLFGFEDEFTEINVRARDLVSGDMSLGFDVNFQEEDVMKGLGKGAVNVEILYGIKDTGDYEHYISLTDVNLTKADLMYEPILVYLTGYDVPFDKFVVVGLKEGEYNRVVDEWSDGRYDGGGLIYLREGGGSEDQYMAVVLHESVHGINSQVLSWDKTNITWFDEGIAKYVEYLVNSKLGLRQAEIFGDDVVYYKGFTKYTHPTRGTAGELWDYYQEDKEFMRVWNPNQYEYRTFGYAFGELVVREYILVNRIESLHRVYDKLAEVDKEIEDVDKKHNTILNALNSDFKPCYSENREEFDACLREINTFVPELPIGTDVQRSLIGEDELFEIIWLEEEGIREARERKGGIFSRFVEFFFGLFE